MKFRPTRPWRGLGSAARAGFTLAEVLAALAFLAIVIPVAVEGIRIAGRAGAVAERKTEAIRVAETLLETLLVTSPTPPAAQSGVLREGSRDYRWQLVSQPWDKDALQRVSLVVQFAVQGRDQEVRLDTLLDRSVP
jgi:prepilin-type N-terminal cleavage/methylation domain-containing protein